MYSFALAPLTAGRHKISQAIGFMMLSVAMYAFQDVLVKSLPADISVAQIVFLRGIFAFIPIIALAFAENDLNLRTSKWGLHLCRSLFSSLALICFIASFRMLPLAEAYTLTFSCPIFMTALCIPLLKEKVSLQRWLAIGLGFIGVLTMMRPGTATFQIGGGLALLGGFFYAISLIYVRALSSTESNTLIVATFTLMSIVLSGICLPFSWTPIDHEIYVSFAIIGTLGGTAQYAMTQAFRLAPVSVIAPFDYASLLWALSLGYLVWGDLPDALMIAGGCTIIASGLYLIHHEKKPTLA